MEGCPCPLSHPGSGGLGLWSAGHHPRQKGKGNLGAAEMLEKEGALPHAADGRGLPVLTGGELAGLGSLPQRDRGKVK